MSNPENEQLKLLAEQLEALQQIFVLQDLLEDPTNKEDPRLSAEFEREKSEWVRELEEIDKLLKAYEKAIPHL